MSENTQESRLEGIFSKGVTKSEFDSFMQEVRQDLEEIHNSCFARIEAVREELHTRMNRRGNIVNEKFKKHAISLMDKTDAINALSRRLSTVEHHLAHPELTEPSYSLDGDSDENEGQEQDKEEEISVIDPADEQEEDGDEQEQQIISPSSSSESGSSSTSDSGDSESDQAEEEKETYYSRRYRDADENEESY